MQHYRVYVRAKTIDNHWVSVEVVYLDVQSWKRFLLHKLVEVGILTGLKQEKELELTTLLTKAQVEGLQ